MKKSKVALLATAVAIASLLVPSSTQVFAASVEQRASGIASGTYGTNWTYHTTWYNGSPAYCTQPHVLMPAVGNGVSAMTGDVYGETSMSGYSGWDYATKQRITALTYFGWGYNGRTSDEWWFATQQAIWDLVDPYPCNWSYVGGSLGSALANINACKDQLNADVNAYLNSKYEAQWQIKDSAGTVVASGNGDLKFDKARVGETYTITDLSGGLSKANTTQNDFGDRAKKSGNSYTITIENGDYGIAKTITAKSSNSQNLTSRGNSSVLYSTSYQRLVTVGTPDEIESECSVTLTGYGEPTETSKYDEKSNLLPGATLSLYYMEGNGATKVATWKSSSTSQYYDLRPGKYRLVEEASPDGYYKSRTTEFTVNATPRVTQYYSMTDEPINYEIQKTDSRTGEQVVGATLQLQDVEDAVPLDEWTTDGTAHTLPSSKLKAGHTYRIVETKVPDGYYEPADNYVFTIPEYKDLETKINDQGIVTLDVANVALDYQVEKVDAKTGEKISGVTLQLLNDNGDKLDEWVTDGTPHKIDKSLISVDKRYYIHEVSTVDGYYLNSKDKSFLVEGYAKNIGSTITITYENYSIQTNIVKVDSETGEYISGVVLGLYDDTGKELDSWTTTDEPYTPVAELTVGKTYTVKEISTVPGYYLNDQEVKFTVSSDVADPTQPTLIEFENTNIEYSVTKTNASTGGGVAGAKLVLTDADSNPIYEFVTTGNADTIPKKYLEAGKSYKIYEKEAIAGLYKSDADIEFTVPKTYSEMVKMKKQMFLLSMKDQEIHYNVAKVDSETGKFVKGAELALYDESGENCLEGPWTTDGDVYEIQTALEAGKNYMLKEISAPNGYYLNAEGKIFTVTEYPQYNKNGSVKTITINMENEKINWRLSKVDTDGNVLTTSKLKPFTIEIYDTMDTTDNVADDELITTLSTDDPKYIDKKYFDLGEYVQGGKTYRVHETSAGIGYFLADDMLVTIDKPDTKSGIITTNLVDEKLSMKIAKVDGDGNVLYNYKDLNGNKYGFILNVYDQTLLNNGATKAESLAARVDTSVASYTEDGYIDVGDSLDPNHTYVIEEESLPYGYYKARDLEVIPGEEAQTVNVVDPKIRVKFRKENVYGEPIRTVNGDSFIFTIYDDETGEAVGSIDTKDGDTDGWVSIGKFLQENKSYTIKETWAPTGYQLSSKEAHIKVPSYSTDEANGYVVCVDEELEIN